MNNFEAQFSSSYFAGVFAAGGVGIE